MLADPGRMERKKMAKYKIEIDRDTCIGDQLCCSEAPNTFDVDDDGIAVVTDPEGDEPDVILAAAQACPVDCIALHDSASGEKVWPED
jgi:ferredoxin